MTDSISGNPGWWLALFFVPLLNIYFIARIHIDFAKKFGQGTGFGIGLWQLAFIFFPLLGFGDYQYQGGGRTEGLS